MKTVIQNIFPRKDPRHSAIMSIVKDISETVALLEKYSDAVLRVKGFGFGDLGYLIRCDRGQVRVAEHITFEQIALYMDRHGITPAHHQQIAFRKIFDRLSDLTGRLSGSLEVFACGESWTFSLKLKRQAGAEIRAVIPDMRFSENTPIRDALSPREGLERLDRMIRGKKAA